MQQFDEKSVERELRRPFWKLRFEGGLENDFIDGIAVRRRSHNLICVACLIALYDLALVPDWLQSPQTFGANAIVRLLIFSPLCLIVIALLKRGVRPVAQELMLGGVLISTVLFETIRVLRSSFDADAAIYQLGGGLCCMMYAAVVMKLRFSTTVAVLLIMFGLKANFVWSASGDIGTAGRTIMMHAFASGVLMLLLAAYLLERTERVGFLLSLRANFLNKELEKAALIDGLTGLGNRRHLAESARLIWAEEGGANTVAAVLIDIDHFKLYNDHHGHVEGDACLRRVAHCVNVALQSAEHMAFRFGGEEFLLLLPNATLADARTCAERVRFFLEQEAIAHCGVHPIASVTASVGIATAATAAASFSDLISVADKALYDAKRAGRNRVWPPEDKVLEHTNELKHLLDEMR